MEQEKTQNYIQIWAEKIQSKGNYTFSLVDARSNFPSISLDGIKLSLNRLKKKNKISLVYKGFYVVVPTEYSAKGILPPTFYIDSLMKFLGKQYYVGLLNAAALHGAAHQQPQEFFVVTSAPAHRENMKKGVKINFITKKYYPEQFIEKKKTQTGYVNVSSPELTAADIVQFERRIGGLNRAATILNELLEVIRLERITKEFVQVVPISTVQRLGYIIDVVLKKKDLADKLFEELSQSDHSFFRIKLKQEGEKIGYNADNRWKIIENTKIEYEE